MSIPGGIPSYLVSANFLFLLALSVLIRYFFCAIFSHILGFIDNSGKPRPWHTQPWMSPHRTQVMHTFLDTLVLVFIYMYLLSILFILFLYFPSSLFSVNIAHFPRSRESLGTLAHFLPRR